MSHETVVFDLDGTLVRLVVDWDAAARSVAEALSERGVEPPTDLWAMLETANETGHRDAVETVLAQYEREGARISERLPAADTIPDGAVGVGVCSLNSEDACRIALERHDLLETVATVVGRDTVATEKPNPEPLLETIRRLEGEPERTLFIGDSRRDEVTADRAGTEFVYVSDWLRA